MRTSEYKNEPEYSEGRSAFVEGERRANNPYGAKGTTMQMLAWWAGWDAEEADYIKNHEEDNG